MDPVAAALLLSKIIPCTAIAFGGTYWVLAAWFDHRLSGVEAAVLLASLLVFDVIGIRLTLLSGIVSFLLLMLLIAVVVVSGLCYLKRMNRRQHEQFDAADIATYLKALDLDPKNAAAHSFLAKIYRRQGKLELALQEYQAAVQLEPSLQEERFWVARLKEELSGERHCPNCGVIGTAEEGCCQGCGHPLGK
jgi:tetratricopeptide (TPR) repeat protein